jgi:hypothetical protein
MIVGASHHREIERVSEANDARLLTLSCADAFRRCVAQLYGV